MQIVDEQVRQYWGRVWQDHPEQSQPALEEALLEAYPQRTQFVLSLLEPPHLRAYLQKSSGAGGACGWTHREFAALPDEALLQMCELYEAMERAAVAPAISCEGDVTLSLAHHGRLHNASHVGGGEIESGSFFECKRTSLARMPCELAGQGMLCQISLSRLSLFWTNVLRSTQWHTGGFGWILLQKGGCPLPIIDVMKDLYSRFLRRLKVLSHLGNALV